MSSREIKLQQALNPGASEQRVKICLNMIVKNEAHVIERCLKNHLGLVDAIAVVDTGSSDETINLIVDFMREHNIPGEVISRKWRHFGPSRTEALRHGEDVIWRIEAGLLGPGGKVLENSALRLAADRKKPAGGWDQPLTAEEFSHWKNSSSAETDPSYDGTNFLSEKLAKHRLSDLGCSWYFMFADADDFIYPEGAEPNKKFYFDRNKLTHDGYAVNMRQGVYGTVYTYIWLVKVDPARRWKWYGFLHEYAAPLGGWFPTKSKITGGFIDSRREGDRSRDPLKYLNDALTLERSLLVNPNNERDVFYLAQSYKDAGKLELARNCYIRRAKMGGWEEEVYMSWFHAAQISIRLEGEQNRLANGQIPVYGRPRGGDCVWLDYLFKAHNARPFRLEAPYMIIEAFREWGWFAAGWHLAKSILEIQPEKINDFLFVDEEIHSWKFFDSASVNAFYSGNREEGLRLVKKALEARHIPEGERARLLDNLKKMS